MRTCCKGVMLVALPFVSTESVFGGLVRCEIDGMRGTCIIRQLCSAVIFARLYAHLRPLQH